MNLGVLTLTFDRDELVTLLEAEDDLNGLSPPTGDANHS